MNSRSSLKPLCILEAILLCLSLSSCLHATEKSKERDSKPNIAILRRVHRLIELTNIERVKAGVAPLKLQENLTESATWMAQDMAKNNYFDHRDSLGRVAGQRIVANGYEHYRAIAENLAAGQSSPKEAITAWLESPGHKANLLSPYFREVGVGFLNAPGTTYETYWVQEFGVRREVCPVIINLEAMSTDSPLVHLYIHGSQWGADQIRISNDGMNWTRWEPYQQEVDWTLDGEEGEKTVYVEIKNSDGDVLSAKDTILLETKKQSQVTTLKPKQTP